MARVLTWFLFQDIVAFQDAYPTLNAKQLLKELAAVDGSILRYFTDRAEDVLKDEMMRDAFVSAASAKKIVLKMSERVNASGRGIGLTFSNGTVEILQQAGAELGSGKAYLDDMMRVTLGSMSDAGPPLALRKELRDAQPAIKSFVARLEKATQNEGWTVEAEDIMAFADGYPKSGAPALVKELFGIDASISRYAVNAVEAICKDELLREAIQLNTLSHKVLLKMSSRVNASGRGIGVAFNNGHLEILQQEDKPLGEGISFVSFFF